MPEVKENGSNWAVVGWGIPPEAGRNGIIISYIVQLLDTHGAVVQNETVAVQDPTFDSPQSLAHNLTNLMSYTGYVWRVAAKTTVGVGPFSPVELLSLKSSELVIFLHCICCSTFLCLLQYGCIHVVYPIAPGPVSELSYEVKSNTSVRVTWKSPKEPNGVIVSYFVEHGVYQHVSSVNENTTHQRKIIRNLSKL